MQFSSDLLTLGPVGRGEVRIYVLVEIALALGSASGTVHLIPRALVVEHGQEVLTYLMDSKTIAETQGDEKAV